MTEIEVQIQERGRITIPVNVRKRHELKEGDWIKLKLMKDEKPGKASSQVDTTIDIVELERTIDLEQSLDRIIEGPIEDDGCG